MDSYHPVDIDRIRAWLQRNDVVSENDLRADRVQLEVVGEAVPFLGSFSTRCIGILDPSSYGSDDWRRILKTLGYIKGTGAQKLSLPLSPWFVRVYWRSALGVLQFHKLWRAACCLLREVIADDSTRSR